MAEEMRIARMMKELQSDLADLVVSGDLTEQEANEWANRKADQWANGIG
jgi:predicted Zn-dependent peptidase